MNDVRHHLRFASLDDRLDCDGWAVTSLSPRLPDPLLRQAAAAVVSTFGVPFFSIDGGHGLRLDGRQESHRAPLGFSGFALDSTRSGAPPHYSALLMVRPDSTRGRCSAVGDLCAAADLLDDVELHPAFLRGRAEHLHGSGTPAAPFSVIAGGMADGGWLRWAGRQPFTGRCAEHRSMLGRFAALLDAAGPRLDRGDLFITSHTQDDLSTEREKDGPFGLAWVTP